MFAGRYYTNRAFAARYFPKVGAAASALVRAHRIVVPRALRSVTVPARDPVIVPARRVVIVPEEG